MRHNKKINHLGRTSSHRQAMLSNMASSLIKHKRIFTTLAKAKALRKYVEPLVTKSKEDTTHSRRIVFASLQDKVAVTELFTKISEKIEDRPGGYTRIIKTGNRLGDNATMCFIELVDFNENMLKTKKAASKTRRSRSKKASTEKAEAATPTPQKESKPKAKKTEAPLKESAPKAVAPELVAEPEAIAPEAIAPEVIEPEVVVEPEAITPEVIEQPEVTVPETPESAPETSAAEEQATE